MKIIPFLFLIFFIFSCAPQKEILPLPPLPPQPAVAKPQPVPVTPPHKYKTLLQCSDNTKTTFNMSGVEMIPFLRAVFFDIDRDGVPEMIAGSKDGLLRLFKNTGTTRSPAWNLSADYFSGIKAGAFSAPALGDIDNDGTFEVLVGTGGFSADSGRVLFYKNTGSFARPVWEAINTGAIKVGNDATPALFDIDKDGLLDLVVGDSTGHLLLFRNKTTGKNVSFAKDASYFKGVNLGMYAVPAVTASGNKIILITGNSMGKISLLEKTLDRQSVWEKRTLSISAANFAAPAFITSGNSLAKDLAIADGNGQLFYYRNINNYLGWELSHEFFMGRLFTGAACTPSVTDIDNTPYMVVGNINGDIRLFEYNKLSGGLPWVERADFFKGLKLSGFSRGILADFGGKQVLITGQHDGMVRAFMNNGTFEKPLWTENKRFFRGLPLMLHAAPAVFDIDGDGRLELIVGDVDGYVRGYRYTPAKDGIPVWEKIEKVFAYVKVDRYATPSLFRDAGKLYLLTGQQDGKIIVFTAANSGLHQPVFFRDDYLQGIRVNNHSSPSVLAKNGAIEMSVGDYNGNLKHFVCRSERIELLQ